MTERISKKTQKKNNALHKFGCLISVIEAGCAIALIVVLIRSALLPNKYLIIISASLLFLFLVFRFLMANAENRKVFLTGMLLAIIVSAACCIVIPYVNKFCTTLKIITSASEDAGTGEKNYQGGPIVMYISGSDRREGESFTNSRTDVNIIAVINPDTREMMLVSTPRDYYVELAYDDAWGSYDKLTHAGYYGIECSMDTLELLYGIDFDCYFRIDFTGFTEIVDALGGITIYSDVAFTAWTDEECSFVVGENYLDGRHALAYVRERYAFEDGDVDRGRHQMDVIKAIVDKMHTSAILNDFNGLMTSLSDNFLTSMSYNTISQLVRDELSATEEWNITQYAVTGYGTTAYTYSGGEIELYVLMPDYDTVEIARELMQTTLDGETPVIPKETEEYY